MPLLNNTTHAIFFPKMTNLSNLQLTEEESMLLQNAHKYAPTQNADLNYLAVDIEAVIYSNKMSIKYKSIEILKQTNKKRRGDATSSRELLK